MSSVPLLFNVVFIVLCRLSYYHFHTKLFLWSVQFKDLMANTGSVLSPLSEVSASIKDKKSKWENLINVFFSPNCLHLCLFFSQDFSLSVSGRVSAEEKAISFLSQELVTS